MNGDSSITGNTALNNGGGIFSKGTVNMKEGGSLTGNTAFGSGGGIYSTNPQVTFDGTGIGRE